MIRLRKQCPEIGWGEWRILPTRTSAVLAIRYDWRGGAVVAVHNLGAAPREVALDAGGGLLSDLLGAGDVEVRRGARHPVQLEPYGYRWFRLGRPNEALARSRTD